MAGGILDVNKSLFGTNIERSEGAVAFRDNDFNHDNFEFGVDDDGAYIRVRDERGRFHATRIPDEALVAIKDLINC